LKIEKEFLEDRQVKINVEVESDPWEGSKRQAARKLAKRVKIPGFRPGKAPYHVIVRTVGEGAILEEALELLVDDLYPKVLEEAEIDPYGPGTLEEVVEFDPPVFDFVIPLQPEVEVGDYKALDIPYEVPETTDEDVDEAIENIRTQHAINEPVERPAEDGDIVYMRVSAKRLDVEDEEEAQLYDQQFSSARLGQEDSPTDRQFFPSFAEKLVGMAPEEEKTFSHTYADDYEDEDLQGAEVEFNVAVTNVQAFSLPDLDDEFAKSASDFETLDEMLEDIKTRLQEQALDAYDDEYETEVVKTLIEDSTLAYPPQMIENEKKDILTNLDYRLSQQGLNKDFYLQYRGISEEEFEEEINEAAEDNVKRTLVLYEVVNTEEIKPDPDKFNETAENAVGSITANMTPKQVKDMQKGGQMANLITNIAADLTLRQAVLYISAIAKGEPLPEPETEVDSDTETAEEAEADLEDGAGEAAPEEQTAPKAEAPTETTDEESPVEESDSEPEGDESEEA
jgi:trigger factor